MFFFGLKVFDDRLPKLIDGRKLMMLNHLTGQETERTRPSKAISLEKGHQSLNSC